MKRTLLFLSILFCAATAFAQWDGISTPWTQGTGTESNPYLISTPNQLAYLSDMVSAGNNYSGKYFLLTNNISLSNQSWMPIGDETHPFKGNFDGGGHTIDSLNITNDSYQYKGLFGRIEYGSIVNVDLKHLNITGTWGSTTIGGFAARIDQTIIQNCSASGIISYSSSISSTSQEQYYGGFVGICSAGTISKCTNHTRIKIYASNRSYIVGGIVGLVLGNSQIVDCCNAASISVVEAGPGNGLYRYIGGILGSNGVIGNNSMLPNVVVEKCCNTDTIHYHTGWTSYGAYKSVFAAGICGKPWINGNSTLQIRTSSNSGPIIAKGICYYYRQYSGANPTKNGDVYASGIANGQCTCSYCWNNAPISATLNETTFPNNYSYIGNAQACGITESEAKCCYNAGQLQSYGIASLGAGLVDSNSYYRDGCGATTGGLPRTEAQMKSVTFPILLNADSTVFVMDNNNENDGYPIFWFTTVSDVTTESATNIKSYSATLHGHYTGMSDTIGFVYGRSSENTAMTSVLLPSSTSPADYSLIGLQPNTNYRFAFFVKHHGAYIYGDTLTFKTKRLYTVSATTNNSSWGVVNGGGSYGYSENCTLTACPVSVTYMGETNTHYEFVQWNDGNTNNPRTITVQSDTTLQANFGPRHYTITTEVNNPAWGSVTGAGVYEYYTPVTVTALPNEGYYLNLWRVGESSSNITGSITGELNPQLINHIGRNGYFLAEFAPIEYTVTVRSADSTMGVVSGSGTYLYGQYATLYADPNYGYVFDHWSDGNTENPRSIVVNANVTYTAIFANRSFSITAVASDGTYGYVTGGGTYSLGSQATLTAIANNGYHFIQWSDGNTTNPRTITVNADATYIAQFAINTYTVSVISGNPNMGSVTGGGVFSHGQQTSIAATAMPHHIFTQWNDGANINPRVVTITSDTSFTAEFEELPQYTISVVSADETRGYVSGGGTFYGGEQTLISATAAADYVFDHWNDGNTEDSRTITITSNATYIAYFSGQRCNVNVFSNDDMMGTVSGGGEYERGTQATVTATPANDYHFVRWNNGVEQNPYTFTVYGDVSLIANFERNTGIDDIEKTVISINAEGLSIRIQGVHGRQLQITDILGRNMYTSSSYNGEIITMPNEGIYFIRIDNTYTTKILLFN